MHPATGVKPLVPAAGGAQGRLAPGAALHLPLAHVKDEEAEGANSYGSNLLPVSRQTIPLILVLIGGSRGGEEEKKEKQASPKSSHLEQVPTTLFPTLKKYKGVARYLCKWGWKPPSLLFHTHHHVLSTEDDPKRQEHSIENALSNVSKEQHPSPVKSNGKPLHRDVNERHGNSQSKDDPGKAETPSLSSLQGKDTESQKPKLCVKSKRRKSGTVWAVAVGCHLLPANPLGLGLSEQPWTNAATHSLWV